MKLFFMISFSLLAMISMESTSPKIFKIGAIFHQGEDANYWAFTEAVREEDIVSSHQLQPIIKWVNASTDSFKTYLAACSLIEEGVIAIFGPGNPLTSSIVNSVTSKFDIPHIEYIFRRIDDFPLPPTTVNMYPDGQRIADALADFLESTDWKQFTVVYETDDALSRLEKVLMKHGPKDPPVTVRKLKPSYDKLTNEPDYRPLLKQVANSTDFNVIFDVTPANIRTIIQQSHEVKLLQDYYHYIITDLHSPTDMMAEILNKTSANVTVIQILKDEIHDYNLTTVESAVLFDGVSLLIAALEIFDKRGENHEHGRSQIEAGSYSCSNPRKYAAGLNITSLMRELAEVGRMSGPIIFNQNGGRSFKLTFKEFQNERISTSGYWEDGLLTIISTQQEREAQAQQSIEKRKFIVTTKLGEPYVMEVTDGSYRGEVFLNGNKRYEGYAVDLIHELSKLLKFTYTFELVPDGEYGKEDNDTKQWNGLLGRLLRREADMAICDLTITKARESAVDFTMPFMDLGISILFAKPENKKPDLFSFLSPFSTDVWIYVATAYVTISVLIFIQARMAPGEWNAAHPCISEPEELENDFSLVNCLWLTAGSLVQAGSDILPRAPSIRMIVCMLWFFVLIMVSSYIANLAAFLTATKLGVSIHNVKELAAQTKIKYGAVKGGSTAGYFEGSDNPMYKRMWATMMEATPSVFEKSNNAGVERVAKGKRTYAFLMESTSLEYAAERNCNLMKVGDPLDSKGYGIALPPNSPYRTKLSEGILRLQERGTLRELKEKWWLKDSKNCSANQPKPSSGELTMAHVGGVFLVLLFGLTLAVFFGILEAVWNARKVAVEEKITPFEAFLAEFKFALNVTAQTKPVKISKSREISSSSSTQELAQAVAMERSIGGSFFQLDTLGKVDNSKGSSLNDKTGRSE